MENRKPKEGFSLLYLVMTVTFCVCLIVANLIEIKTVDIGLLTITAGVIVFPVSYIINDCIVEVYGFRRAKLTIWIGFASSLFVTLMLQLAIALPGSEEWSGQQSMETVYGGVPRIMAASFLAFVCGSMVNAYTMSRMKAADKTRSRFSLRAIVSTLLGEGVDSLVFFPVAFAGTLHWSVIISLMVSQALLKTAYEVIVLPVTVRAVRRIKKAEGIDTVDRGVSYKWWKINEI